MHIPRLHAPRHGTLVAYLALALSLSGTAYAATGGTFKLGYTNKADQTSTLVNTGSGPALKVRTRTSAPPLAVTSRKKVARLNADLLDGVDASALSLSKFTGFALKNSWTGDCYGGGLPGYARLGKLVVLHGEMCGGADDSVAFTVPASIAPAKTQWLATPQCNGATGRIDISTNGDVRVESDPGDNTAANCFVSLQGVFYTLPS